MADARATNERRVRRLEQMKTNGSAGAASGTLKAFWHGGRRPAHIVVRSALLKPVEGGPLLTRLVLPRGVALRFYLLALFEAQCRLAVGGQWENVLPLSGPGSWSDMIASDGAYDGKSGTYMRGTRGGRAAEDLRLRQVQGALRTLEEVGGERPDQALVEIPRGSRGQRLYPSFRLLQESGRGSHQSPDIYTVPADHWHPSKTVTIPAAFFLNGWVQVLSPSEVATWLALRVLSKWAPDKHQQSGVFLYGDARKEQFGLQRDAWEDGCQRLLDFGLIRFARPMKDGEPAVPPTPNDWLMVLDQPEPRARYEPHRYQVIDEGLDQDAVKVCHRELTLRQHALDRRAAEVQRQQIGGPQQDVWPQWDGGEPEMRFEGV
ncbi:hypothetical protein ACFCYI_04080 [Streptomyces sp. NPDC056257]|uniref:hypothetical protein n=1 Tax=Streptomyces sp. NPDC056257 TaxID=3345765 RepID=UPI0035DD983C